ncbi:DNA helicase IV [Parasalinivibrio latis]|uniref:DNA helicase IV n=1 Tax=Parasalinivibrio latis TaxID=2952610 RepID=UPI0030E456C0
MKQAEGNLTSPVTAIAHQRELGATPLARWFVQWDNYSISIDDNSLILESHDTRRIVPFATWNGELTVARGLLWGKLTLTARDKDGRAHTYKVFGLPWKETRCFADYLVSCWRDWAAGSQRALDAIWPDITQLLQQLQQARGYLRQSEVAAVFDQIQALLARAGLELSLLRQIDPDKADCLGKWLGQESWLAQRNEAWSNQAVKQWSSLFDSVEASPLNESQREAVVTDDDFNLVLAGAGSGKTSVLVARAAYLVQSGQALPEQILMLAFGRKAADEMKERLAKKVSGNIRVSTFHGFAREIIRHNQSTAPEISELATDDIAQTAWITLWLAEHWQVPASEKRWLKHAEKFGVPGVDPEKPLLEQTHNEKLHRWLWRQVDVLRLIAQGKKEIQSSLERIGEDLKQQSVSELNLVWPCYKAYLQKLKEEGKQDFSGLIADATKLLEKGKGRPDVRFIMVDEYQDISPDRLSMLEALCRHEGKNTRSPSLYAVGDDWQAIYRFTGADVSLTTDFEKRFGHAAIRNLDTTYRFNDKIGEVAKQFVMVNPTQLDKTLTSVKKRKSAAVSVIDSDGVEALLAQLNEKQNDGQIMSLMLIGRANHHRPESLSKWKKEFSNLSIEFVTAHASKGREADCVVVLAMNEGVFPSVRNTHHLDDCLLMNEEPVDFAEERRLFYVSLTRAREQVWLACDPKTPSPFVTELLEGNYGVSRKKTKSR